MPSGTEYVQLYGQANAAYCQGNLEEAAITIKEMIGKYPDDPNVILLQGHIHLGLQQYKLARDRYEIVLQLANTPEHGDLLDYARRGLEQIRQSDGEEGTAINSSIIVAEGIAYGEADSSHEVFLPSQGFEAQWSENSEDTGAEWNNEAMDWDSNLFNEDELNEPTIGQTHPYPHLFEESASSDVPPQAAEVKNRPWPDRAIEDEPSFPFLAEDEFNDEQGIGSGFSDLGEATFVVSSDLRKNSSTENLDNDHLARWKRLKPFLTEESHVTPSSSEPNSQPRDKANEKNEHLSTYSEKEDFLDNLEEFSFNDEDLESLSPINLQDVARSLRDSDLFTHYGNEANRENFSVELNSPLTESSAAPSNLKASSKKETSLANASERLLKPSVEVELGKLAILMNAPLQKKPFILAAIAGLTPIVMIFAVSLTTWLASPSTPAPNRKDHPAKVASNTNPTAKNPAKTVLSPFSQPVLTMMFLTGAGAFAFTWLVGQLMFAQMKRTLSDLQTQFDSISEGNFNVKATIHSEDELGQLASRFNQMARVISTTTSEAQHRAAETEQAREDLQRQVIRLLDDVEGAARGDLMVEAAVSADVLGAVADAFNLTIQNLREIVRQVKKAAKQVNQGSTDSESFARNQSSDALRMAEELAVTLNSVQMMTESIQRVAENAREAEEVARTSSITALKGGESVERTVAGILQIRDTVSETARKVKRLAEASQEISKIVALISQIASRTNLLALNASIQAARAGEAGRGFAIVADEVRQLADRSAKSLKEIEQIVLQIQSETGSVMTAMEEGIQQVIDVTERSEQAKKSLEDIIQVSNRIDTLVRSITADTVKQRENSKNVAHVMQSVELTAQETSQESQRVAGSLQKLVGISRDLLTSVERFKVDPEAGK
jgi:twitching motility protein PilJ